MNDSLIEDLTQQLDAAIPRDGAMVRIETDAGLDPDQEARHFRIIANRAGYLRLGVACLQAASAPYLSNDRAVSDAIESATGDLFGGNDDDVTVGFERNEDLQWQRQNEEAHVPSDWRLGLISAGALVAFGMILLSLVVGAIVLALAALSALTGSRP
jgi:hypothetical protein